MPSPNPRLFQPMQLGQMHLKHRIVLAPLTRLRADENHVPTLPLMKEYYTQRGSTPGTLLISEGLSVAPGAVGNKHIPGIYNPDQVRAWTEVRLSTHFLETNSGTKAILIRSWNLSTDKAHIFSVNYGHKVVKQTLTSSNPKTHPLMLPLPAQFHSTPPVHPYHANSRLRKFKNIYDSTLMPQLLPYIKPILTVSRFTLQMVI